MSIATPEDVRPRCSWAGTDPLYIHYHDGEWGRPVASDTRLFEKICLEGFQSGLAWITILRKRENFRAAFAGFEIERVAAMDETDIERLMADAGIVRHRGKIASTINNARRAQELQRAFGSLAAYFWQFAPPVMPGPDTAGAIPPMSELSKTISKDLRKRGWSFVGPTTVYAFMQAMGMVNDHVRDCWCHDEVERAQRDFKRPERS